VHLSPEGRAGQQAIGIAETLLGRPYVFGGRSALGTDCSGLVSDAYAALGHMLPRDARQQVLVGKLVATRWHRTALRPGDTLFFIDSTGRVIHTGLALGGSRFIHQCPPEVQVSSFDPADPLYSETCDRAFIFGRRPTE
jgi:cell wall-associated NlpC family hydrolase